MRWVRVNLVVLFYSDPFTLSTCRDDARDILATILLPCPPNRTRGRKAQSFIATFVMLYLARCIRLTFYLGSTESEEDFSWEDEDESTPSTAVQKSPAAVTTSPSENPPQTTTSAPPSETPTPATTSPRESSEESYDVVSSDNASAAGKGKREDKKPGESDDGGDSDWE